MFKNKKQVPWKDLNPAQQKAVVAVGAFQITLTALALRDIARRPSGSIRGSRTAWTLASFVNFIGPLAYFAFGRRRNVMETTPRPVSRRTNQRVHGFDRTLQETHRWLNDIEAEMNHPSDKMAYHALRGVLGAIRDRLPTDDLFGLSAQLPMLIRGILFEGYQPAGKPEKYHREEFLARVAAELQQAGGANPEKATRAVFRVMTRHLSSGEMAKIHHAMPHDLRQLLGEPVSA